jgi:hypothetical protein
MEPNLENCQHDVITESCPICKLVWTPEVIQAAKRASLAMAEFWDELRQFEIASKMDFDGTAEMIGILASEHGYPPSIDDLGDQTVIGHLRSMLAEQVRPRPTPLEGPVCNG